MGLLFLFNKINLFVFKRKYQVLMTIPEIGAATAVPIAIGAKDISRFDSARQFQAFFGYHTCHSGSGGKVVMGKMASNGDRAVKKICMKVLCLFTIRESVIMNLVQNGLLPRQNKTRQPLRKE